LLAAAERETLAAVIIAEERRALQERLLAPLFDRQRAFIEHPARRKALLGSRRAGKTTMGPRRLLLPPVRHPGTFTRFFGITRLRAKELMWEPLKRACHEMQLDAKINESELSVRVPVGDGSWIYLNGADKLKEAQKKVGDKLAHATIDESQLYPDDVLKALTEDILPPALEDVDGTLELWGTPGPVCVGVWWELTRDDGVARAPGWHVDSWTVLENPAYPRWAGRPDWKLAAIEWLAAMKAARDWPDDHPTYLREWRGRWVNDIGALVYKYDDVRNGFDGVLPPLPDGERWSHFAGSDLGTKDAFSIVVWAFNRTIRPAYEAYSFAESGLLPDDWAQHWRRVNGLFRPIRLRVDTGGLGSPIVEGILRDPAKAKGLPPIEAAQKTEKAAYQELMNGEFLAGRLMVRRGGPYATELARLPKDPDDETNEDERYANHCCDAGLYSYRDLIAAHFQKLNDAADDQRTDAEKQQARADAYKKQLQQRLAAQKEKPWWDRSKKQ
jgi:hypothetical protein